MSLIDTAGRRRSARGQATPLLAIALLLAVLLLVPTAALIATTRDRAQAQTAADAAALAGIHEGETAARRMAADNGAQLVRYQRVLNWAEVTVQVGRHRATARAEIEIHLDP